MKFTTRKGKSFDKVRDLCCEHEGSDSYGDCDSA